MTFGKNNMLGALRKLLLITGVSFFLGLQPLMADETLLHCQDFQNQVLQDQQANQLDQILPFLAQSSGSFDFVERKYLKNIDQPLITKGILIYRPPSFLEKQIHHPTEARLVINDKILMQQIGERNRRKLHLDDYPKAHDFVQSLMAILRGDIADLAKDFHVYVSKNETSGWYTCLWPRHNRMQQQLMLIVIVGEGEQVDIIRWYDRQTQLTELEIVAQHVLPNIIDK